MKLPTKIDDWHAGARFSYETKLNNLLRRNVPEGKAKAQAEFLTRDQFRTRSEAEEFQPTTIVGD